MRLRRAVGLPASSIAVLTLATLTYIAGAVLASPFFVFYAECFRRQDHVRRILDEAQTIVNDALAMVTPGGQV